MLDPDDVIKMQVEHFANLAKGAMGETSYVIVIGCVTDGEDTALYAGVQAESDVGQGAISEGLLYFLNSTLPDGYEAQIVGPDGVLEFGPPTSAHSEGDLH